MAVPIADMEKFVKASASNNIPVFLWLVLPVAIIVIQTLLEILVPQNLLGPMLSEGGPHETLQFLFSALACFLAARMCFQLEDRLLKGLMLCIALGCFYIAGEEISWGQWVFGWITPEFWQQVNDQSETNLHNTSAWLDQKPRLLLFIGIMVGGLLVPALRRWWPSKLPAKYAVLYPSDALVVTALGVTIPYFIQEVAEALGFHPFERVSEVQELYMYYFLFLYLIDFHKRVFSQV